VVGFDEEGGKEEERGWFLRRTVTGFFLGCFDNERGWRSMTTKGQEGGKRGWRPKMGTREKKCGDIWIPTGKRNT